MRFTVVGTIRDGSRHLGKEVDRIYKALLSLGSVQFFVVESDSSDSTPSVLASLKAKIEGFDFVSLGNLREFIPDRIERLIYCRNQYLEAVKCNPSLSGSNYVIVADLDNVNKKISTHSIENSLASKVGWAGLFANQSKKYYDLLALRHPYWCPNNVFEEFESMKMIVSQGKALRRAVYSKMIHIERDRPLISVESAFGGFAIYKTDFFLNSSYTRTSVDSIGDIDHVIFNRRIREAGGELFIDPQLINASWTTHSKASFTWYRKLARGRKRLVDLVSG